MIGAVSSFGRTPPRPAQLGGITEEVEALLVDFEQGIEDRLDAWAASNTRYYSGLAFESFRERWEADKGELVEGLRQPVQKVIGEILDDAETKARLGEAKKSFERSLTKVAVIAVLGGVATTWAVFRWLPPRLRR